MKSKGAVLYGRVSTGEQAKSGTSLESQLEVCRSKAERLGIPIIAEYQDAGISGGFLLLRDGMQAAIAEISIGRADTLICANLSRYSRDVEHQQAIKKQVANAGGRVVFADIDFDDTPEGDLAFNVLGGFAQYERANIRKRTMDGKRRRAMNGTQPCRSFAPFGYRIPTTADVIRGDYPVEQLGTGVVLEVAHDPDGIRRQLAAIVSAGDRRPMLRRLRLPALVVHGDADPLVRPSGGRATARAIPGAKLVIYPGMGHDLPVLLQPDIADEIAALARRWSPAR